MDLSEFHKSESRKSKVEKDVSSKSGCPFIFGAQKLKSTGNVLSDF